ncbi:MAG: hypothetical protein ABI706_04720 [Ilumatobacteraceae bacterium]
MARPRLVSPTIALRRNAIYKGLLGGQRGWLAIGAVVWAPRLLKKALGRTEQVVATERLEPGQALRIEAIKRPTRAEDRARRRAR